jgi:hypothetical protein
LFLDQALLARAPFLPGPHAVFYNDGLNNYYDWLISSVLPLTLMAPRLRPGTTLPATLSTSAGTPKRDYLALPTALGFGDMALAEIKDDFCLPGTKVLELPPECEYRPCFNEICSNLGLDPATLLYATEDGTFDGRITVDRSRLRALFKMLQHRLASYPVAARPTGKP